MEYMKILHQARRVSVWLYDIVRRYHIAVACMITVFLFAISFLMPENRYSVEKEAARLEKKIQQRQHILEDYVAKAFETPIDKRLSFQDFPEDMVIYKYNADTAICSIAFCRAVRPRLRFLSTLM